MAFLSGISRRLRNLRRHRSAKQSWCRSPNSVHFQRRCGVERLEERTLLSIDMQYHYIINNPNSPGSDATGMDQGSSPLNSSSPIGMTPSQIRMAYGIDQVTFGTITGNGSGQTIAIIDAYDDPAFVSSTDPGFANSDLHNFDVQFGLPDPPSFLKLNQTGGTAYPTASGSTGWSVEEALDVEWATCHCAPGQHHTVRGQYAERRGLGFDCGEHRPQLVRGHGDYDELWPQRIEQRHIDKLCFHHACGSCGRDVFGVHGRQTVHRADFPPFRPTLSRWGALL